MIARGPVGRITPYLYLAPALIVLGVFIVGSFFQVILYSLGRFDPFAQELTLTGFDNYAELFADQRFWFALGNSFLYLLVTPALIVVSLSCAMVIDAKIRGAGLFRLLFFLPVVTPTIVAAIAWRVVFNEDSGVLTAGVESVFGEGTSPRWLTERPWTLVTPMVVTLWKGFGFYMMIFLAALLNVPRDLREAAAIDGAGRWGTFINVVLPAIWPTMTLVVIISSISALKVFDELFVTVRGVPIEQQTAVPYIYEVAFGEGSFGVASAAGVVLFVVLLIFSMINLKITGGAK